MATGVEREAKLSRARSVATLRIREHTEELEGKELAAQATKSAAAKRAIAEEPSPTRTSFAVDRDRIVHSKAFRRTKHKTQVFLAPVGDHYRTRLTHILEVNSIGRAMATALQLNEDLLEAMALGHDIGHTPFGHVGEELLARFLPDGFRHNQQSVRIVERIEKNGKGLNLTREVLEATNALRDWMFENVYLAGPAKTEDEKAQGVLLALLQYFEKHADRMPPEYQRIADEDGVKRAVADYVAGMTDAYALDTYES